MEHRLKLTVAYDGSRVWGSQRQAGRVTVQSILEEALSRLAEAPVAVDLAGRTDRGVHAAGQVASCVDIRPEMPPEAIRRALEPNPVTRSRWSGSSGYTSHARHDATWREYRYRFDWPRSPLIERHAWHRRKPLDVVATPTGRGCGEARRSFVAGEGVPGQSGSSADAVLLHVRHCAVREVDAWWPPPLRPD